ncbi:tfiiic transcription initiation factor complex subunits tfc3 [Trichoderma cornu-damae]|uniref:Tfiiic transcription initiation factor complex subunits tfc3 n=1 Tax=Trichoderma cornu-damae TaxID=654480 RepID=A0A9P8QHD0_9HYPO|nr:tfiiic transcription initiation factor complex subunits tfc3 [Trichoderma cornu-damae]
MIELLLDQRMNTFSPHNKQDVIVQDPVIILSDHVVGTIWTWLVQRIDISIGAHGEYNHPRLEEVLALKDLSKDTDSSPVGSRSLTSNTQQSFASTAPAFSEHNDIRIYASQETMWEAITGHAVDYKRVPRSEWLLLLGIASTKAQGILQGDLGRLVDQDKRSVPKRTDALVKKGYIAKRTTLVRGTKTSKMWLKLFAPPLPKDRSAAAEPEAEMNLSRQVLAINLDAVPWHTRWTGESVDYTALATTIMAICKEWGVLRMQDLKAKLGVLGMRWQMKVVSKVCRFLNARDAIRYVAANLNNKMFNDCVRFNRDLTPKDWSIFLATGKRAGKVAKSSELHSQDGHDGTDSLLDQPASSKCLGVAPPWLADQPLAVTITRSITACGEAGLTNPDVYGLTLGASFTRFLSSLTTCISSPNIQPAQLQHLQVRSEHSRAGKVASYRYSMTTVEQEHEWWTDSCLRYGFSRASYPIRSSKLANLSQVNLSQRRQRGRPRKIRSEQQGDLSGDDNNVRQTLGANHGPVNTTHQNQLRTSDSMIIKLRIPQEALRELVGSLVISSIQETASPESILESPKATGGTQTSNDDGFLGITTPPPFDSQMPMEYTQSLSHGRNRGRGRGSSHPTSRRIVEPLSNDIAKRKRWKCDKCGRTWKNDIGLKYHLEKSQTSCNPSYSPSNIDGCHREMKSTVRPPSISNSRDNATKAPVPLKQRSHRAETNVSEEGGQSEGGRGYGEQDDVETSQFQISPTRIKVMGDRYSHNPISKTPPTIHGHAKHIYPLNQSSYNQSISEQRKIFNTSSIHHGQIALMKADIGHLNQALVLKNRKYHVTQLENLPTAPTETRMQQSRPYLNFTQAFSKASLQKSRSRDERRESISGTTAPTDDMGKIEVDLVNQQQSYDAVSANLESESSKRKPLKSEVLDNISALLIEMLIQRNGVLPGGHSLWRYLTIVWNIRYPEKPVPKTKDYQWALSRMLKDKAILEHWHGFQDYSGLFSKCQVLTLPHLDAFSAEVLAVVENMKLRQPQPFIPAQFQSLSSDVEFGERKENRRRRILAGEVAQLDAPVYAAQVSAKRRHGVVSDITNPNKRRRSEQTTTKRPNFASLSTPVHERYRIRWTQNSWLPKTNALNLSIHRVAHMDHRAKIQFLAPNRFLEDDCSLDDHGVPQGMTQASYFTDTNVAQRKLPATVAVGFAMAESKQRIMGKDGSWPYLELQFFEEKANDASFTMCGWMPDAKWFHWADMVQGLNKRISTNEAGRQYCAVDIETAHDKFMRSLMDCLNVELAQTELFANASPLVAGPHNIFINLSAGFENTASVIDLRWQLRDQLTPQSINRSFYDSEALKSSDDEDSEFGLDTSDLRHVKRALAADEMNQSKIKRVALISRPLTSISRGETYTVAETGDIETGDSQLISHVDLLAAFIVIRVLLGGADKAIDWGLLLHIFPNTRLSSLRKFWAAACKEEGPHIKKFTRDVQERLIEALENGELPMINFEDPVQYDWQTLIKWATRISRQEGYQIPRTRGLLANRFLLIANTPSEEDWCERFFHAQSSIFSRFEAVTSEPGALPVEDVLDQVNDSTYIENADIARSWIKSLCCTGEAKYSVRKIREKFLTLSREGTERSSHLLKEAIDQLTIQRVICRSKKTPFGARPYRLSEWYLSTLNRVAQRSKYEDAAAFKMQMDDRFSNGENFEIPYTLNDGSMMALTNLNATGRIELVPLGIPNIPFGFEPGNYESRKYPKSYYHFRLQAIPTDSYQHSRGIAVLQAVMQEDLPSITPKGEIPQWIDFFGEKDNRRWSDILGALCFSFATKGPMAARDVCNSLRPILDEFEARLIVDWGIKTGVFEEVMVSGRDNLREETASMFKSRGASAF